MKPGLICGFISALIIGSQVASTCTGEDSAGSALDRQLPPAEEIRAIMAETYQEPFGLPDIGQFRVPDAFYASLLSRFRGGVPDATPSIECVEIGSIKLITSQGRVYRISWYHLGDKAPLHFSFQGIRFVATRHKPGEGVTDESLEVDGMIRQAYYKKTGHKTNTIRPLESQRSREVQSAW